ncbi:FAD/FMN-containing dehydrogenase [Thermomonospora echinospora]|uniref:FAD/FMN-containing dehydrogenase n=1 Tax=Thermomonospora echinospora TaxID=1992 RepID=A0A1H5SQQ1_9ACTN|nr:FAD-binding oxidoreductase [Thermomonospora echinospora]SEF52181.1 FAD/FMN-containing dehydrogenase [Thermomonospora echinospora]
MRESVVPAVRELRDAGLRVLLPGDNGYDTARQPWRRLVEHRPALIAEAAGSREVQAVVRAAGAHGLPITVQSTGHGAVRACDGGLLLRTSAMNGVRVDPARRTVRVGAGAVWGDVVTAAAPFGLAPLSGSSPTVGVVGYTLGGGTGWMSRRHGYAADGVLGAEVVTADGEMLTVRGDEHPDLLWAMRGGGGGFALVTALELPLYPVGPIYAGMAVFGFDRAAQVLARYREWAPEEPDESNTAITMMRMPPSPELPEPLRGRRVLALRVFYLGEADDAERMLAPLREAAGAPLVDGLRPIAYADTSTLLRPPPPPSAIEERLELLDDLPGDAVDAMIGVVEDGGPVAAVDVRHWGGAMARPPEGAGPAGHRDVPFSAMFGAEAERPEQVDAVRSAVRDAAARIGPYTTGGTFLNFLTDPDRTAAAFTPQDYRRLAEVKKRYDPANLFAGNHVVLPES